MMKRNDGAENPAYGRIWSVIAAIPAGTVLGYGQVADLAGLPGRARMVARALREAPDALQLPWHRVLRADGRIAFAPGDPRGEEQRRRLLAEGVVFNGRRVAPDAIAPERLLDFKFWGP
ncbi:MAG: MGMT family protein [Wenzhouxiangellaceae bacterium]